MRMGLQPLAIDAFLPVSRTDRINDGSRSSPELVIERHQGCCVSQRGRGIDRVRTAQLQAPGEGGGVRRCNDIERV